LVLTVLLWALSAGALLIAGSITSYYLFLAIVQLVRPRRSTPLQDSRGKEFTSFVIVIPAHNESASIGQTIRSCQELDYPCDRYSIVVVADNCSDDTALLARESGATCLVRQNQAERGKGYALAFAFDRIDMQMFEAAVILDADCRIDRNALSAFSTEISRGRRVLQAKDVASNPDQSPMSYALCIGNVLENDLFYAPKSRLGWAVLLRGTGMVLHRDILRRFPWSAFSIGEDFEYAVTLARHGIEVCFVDSTGVYSDFPSDVQQLGVQRRRWASGTLGLARHQAIHLMWEGLRRRNWVLFDTGWTFLTLSRPLLLLMTFSAFAVALLGRMATGDGRFDSILVVSAAVLFLLALYVLLGILSLGVTAHRLKLLVQTLGTAIRLIATSLVGLLSGKKSSWTRTPRKGD